MKSRCVHRTFFALLVAGLFAVGAEPLRAANWSADMATFAAQDAAKASPRDCVLFVGSSSIRLWKTLAEDFSGTAVVNRGFGGSQIADSVEHFDRLVQPHHPRLVVFYAGTNDLAAGKTPRHVADDFATFCARLHSSRPEAKLVFISIQFAPARWELREKMAEANALIAAFCAADPRRSFLETNPAMLDAKGEPRLELYVVDRLHMSPAGYAVWRGLLAPVVQGTR